MANLKINDINKNFGNTEVLKGINLDIDDGDFLVLLGPSGCGKSTLLNTIAGLEKSDSGEILIDDYVVNEMEPSDRDIALVFQSYALYPAMTVKKNVTFGLEQRKTSKDKIEESLTKVSNLLKITELLERKPSQLSGGQRQRVAMGRALVRNPKVFLFDEPLSNLDAKLRVQMRLEIKKLQRKLNVTSLYVTHDQVEAMTLADKMIVMNEGNVEHIGTPLEVYQKPKSLFTAQFIGSPAMNILKGTADGNEIKIGDFKIKSENSYSGEVNFGIRPEHLSIDDNGPIKATVEFIELIGSNTLIHCRIKTSNEVIVVSIPGIIQENLSRKEIKLDFDQSKIHLFNTKDNSRIN